jgi:Uncharacterized protein conserved in bacteria (DUF2188)
MSNRKTYYVSPRGSSWAVKGRGADRAVGVFETKVAAVDRARDVARNQSQGQVVIQRRDGSFQTEYTYGKDPFPPRG